MVKPIQVADLEDLQPGDIILFRPPLQDVPLSIKLIGYVQALLNQQDGHYDTTHAAVVTKASVGIPIKGVAEDGTPYELSNPRVRIKHVMNDGLKSYTLTRDNEAEFTPNYIIFRPKDPEMQVQIAKTTKEFAKNKEFTWKISAAITAFKNAVIGAKDTENKDVATATICSGFVTDIIKEASKNNSEYSPKIPALSLPKVLEAELYKNPNYEMLSYTGKDNAYVIINNIIHAQQTRMREDLTKLLTSSSAADQEKAARINEKLTDMEKALKAIDQDPSFAKANDMEKAIRLVKDFKPILKFNTGYGFKDARSYHALSKAAQRIGIHDREIHHYESTQKDRLNREAPKNEDKEELKEEPHPSSHKR